MTPSLNHVALLVRSAKGAAAICSQSGYDLGPVEDFPSEGTREIYVGSPATEGLLLLMEAIGDGPYRNALKKRGPGLHHIAVHVPSVLDYVTGLASSGWLLHPMSLHMLTDRKTVYLARPGLRALIEVKETNEGLASGQSFITEVHLEGAPDHQRLLDALGVPGLRLAGKEGAAIVIGGRCIALGALSSDAVSGA